MQVNVFIFEWAEDDFAILILINWHEGRMLEKSCLQQLMVWIFWGFKLSSFTFMMFFH